MEELFQNERSSSDGGKKWEEGEVEFADAEVQSEPIEERLVIKELLSDPDVLRTLSSKRPDLMAQLVKLATQRF